MADEICRIVEDDLVTVRLDLNGLFAGTTGFRLAWIREGETNQRLDVLTSDTAPGGALASATPELTEMALGLKSAEASLDALLALMRSLGTELERGGVIEYRSRTTTVSKFYRFLPATIPALLHGDKHDRITIAQFRDERGFEVSLLRQPFAFRTTQAGAATAVANAGTARHLLVANPGNVDSPAKLTATPEAGAEIGAVTVAIRSKGNLTGFASIYSKEAEAGSMFSDTAAAADADASGGNVALCTFATIQTLARRWKSTWTHADPKSLEGKHTIMCRYKLTGTTLGQLKLQLRHGGIDINPLPKTGEIIDLDWSDVGVSRFVTVALGDVVVPPGSDTLVAEIWAQQVTGDFDLSIDDVWLVPSDEQVVTFSVPGQRLGEWGAERWTGDELEGTGHVVEERYWLNAQGEIARIPPVGGIGLPAGVHIFEFVGIVRNPARVREIIGKLSLVSDPSGLATELAATQLRSKKNRLFTRIRRRNRKRVKYTVGAAEADGAVMFQPRVIQTAATLQGRRIAVGAIRHSFLKAFTDGTPLVVDTAKRKAYGATAGEAVFPAIMEGDFPVAPGGDSLWLFVFHDLTPEIGYDELDPREPSLKAISGRDATVKVDVIPQVTH